MPSSSIFAASPEVWASHLAAQADLPDERLNTRFGIILASLAQRPADSIPQAAGSWSQTKAVYRFLSNPRLDIDHFMQPLVDTTLDSIRSLPTILAVQDTSSTNYAALKQTRGLGPLNDSDARGLHVHSTLAVRPDGVVIGLLHQRVWSRPTDTRSAPQRRERPIAEKESYKWLEGIEAAEAALEQLPAAERPRLIHVMDREGDVHEVLERLADSPHGAVIRSAQNRTVAGPDPAHDAVAASPLLGTITLDIPAGHGLKARRVRVELRSLTVTITPNRSKHPERGPTTWNLIEVREAAPVASTEPLHWLLWTTEPAATVQQIKVLLGYYKLRWRVEDFHLTLKSGCQVEELALETAERLAKALLLYSAVAIRLVALRDLARVEPMAPCTTILSEDGWQVLSTHFEGRRPTAETPIPTVRQAIIWIGRLGGHLARKRDGLPGVRVLWRGWRDLTLLATGWSTANSTR
jgi:hypothetical protein